MHFYDFYLKFEKWMSDLIKLHNDIMSVHQKLIECDKALNTPYEFQRIDLLIDSKINNILELILAKKTAIEKVETASTNGTPALAMTSPITTGTHHQVNTRLVYSPATPPQTICSNNSSKNNSIEIRNNAGSVSSSSNYKDDNNNNMLNMINFKFAQNNIDTVLTKYKIHTDFDLLNLFTILTYFFNLKKPKRL